jgi:stress-induced morphogen
MDEPTGQKSNAEFLQGNKLYIQRARIALPILVRQAKARKSIYYSDLAEEMGMPNPRNLNWVLGAIGNALKNLEELNNEKIPLVNCIVINKSNHLPGEGIGWFIESKQFEKLSKNQKKELVNQVLSDVFSYQKWDLVLKQLGLKPLKSKVLKELDIIKRTGKSGESEFHLKFKKFLANNPQIFELKGENKGTIEYQFPSADSIDVIFQNKSEIIGVEAKSKISDTNDILRGLFQCVKYQALIEAEQKVQDKIPNCRVVLALENKFPKELISVKNQLGIEVLDEIKMK